MFNYIQSIWVLEPTVIQIWPQPNLTDYRLQQCSFFPFLSLFYIPSIHHQTQNCNWNTQREIHEHCQKNVRYTCIFFAAILNAVKWMSLFVPNPPKKCIAKAKLIWFFPYRSVNLEFLCEIAMKHDHRKMQYTVLEWAHS